MHLPRSILVEVLAYMGVCRSVTVKFGCDLEIMRMQGGVFLTAIQFYHTRPVYP